jgi:hypothetical protein
MDGKSLCANFVNFKSHRFVLKKLTVTSLNSCRDEICRQDCHQKISGKDADSKKGCSFDERVVLSRRRPRSKFIRETAGGLCAVERD